MSATHIQLTPELAAYLRQVSLREPQVLAKLRADTATLARRTMQITPEQGQFMGLLTRLIGARRALEVGVFTGYSSTSVALQLPPDGELVACDASQEWTSIAHRYWCEAGVDSRIKLHLGPARATLERLLAEGQQESFDIAFIDADKESHDVYFELCYRLVRKHGLILIDNVLWHGQVADASQQDAETVAIRALNEKLVTDERVSLSMLPIGDGLTVTMKR